MLSFRAIAWIFTTEVDALLFKFSLQATWIRNTILHALRQNDISVGNVPQNFVYSAPTISQLTDYVAAIINPSADKAVDGIETKAKELRSLVADLTTDFPAHNPTAPASATEVVLITGTTGGLGSAILANIIALPSVFRVYALNRKSRDGADVRQRQVESFESRGLDTSIVDSPKVVFVEGDTSSPTLDVPKALFAEVSCTVY